MDDAVEKVIVNDDFKKRFLLLVNNVVRLYKAILPDHAANQFAPVKTCLAVLGEKIRGFLPEVSVEEVMRGVEQVLDDSIAPTSYTPDIYETKCDLVYRHIYDNYFGEERSVYEGVAGGTAR